MATLDCDQRDVVRRWARTVVVNDVLGLIYHTFDGEKEQDLIIVMIQADGASVTTRIGRKRPFTQAEFDAIKAEELVRAVIRSAADMGLEPTTVTS